jgi:hypothetical protein
VVDEFLVGGKLMGFVYSAMRAKIKRRLCGSSVLALGLPRPCLVYSLKFLGIERRKAPAGQNFIHASGLRRRASASAAS